MILTSENEAYAELLCGHLGRLTRRLRAMHPERWDWQPMPTSPSCRRVAQHVWLWLVCDRQHLLEPDAFRHTPPTAPDEQAALCDLLDAEAEHWRTLLRDLTAQQLAEERLAFNWRRVNVRWLVWHMCQNVIYKHGQVAALYFQLGLDGPEPYHAPLPQNDYNRLHEMTEHPPICWALAGYPPSETPQTEIDERDRAGCTALHYAVWRGDAAGVERLLDLGADVNASYGEGWTALMDAAWLGHVEMAKLLIDRGAIVEKTTSSGHSALGLARMQRVEALCRLLVDPGEDG